MRWDWAMRLNWARVQGKYCAMAGACLVALVAAGPAAGTQTVVTERIARVERGLLPRVVLKGWGSRRASIAERMSYHGIPGMSIAVVEDGRVAWARAYGVRDRDAKGLITTETLFQAASLSKPVSAIGVLLLAQAHRLDLDGDMRQWLRSWKPDQAITLRQTLSHTAGLNAGGFAGYVPGAPLPTAVQILNGQSPANNESVRVVIPPGSEVRYSGGGFVAVQQLVVDLTRTPFDEFMRRAVLGPLGMTRSGFEQPLSAERAHDAASGHRREGTKLAGNWMVQPELAAAGLWTTPTDLAQVVIELQDALAGRPARTLTTESAREMLTARQENAGLGVFLAGPNGASRRFLHSGRNAGFDALLVGYKNGRQGAVIMINRNNNGHFIDEVVDSIAREYNWPDYVASRPQLEYEAVPSSIQASYTGVYEAGDRPSLTVVFEDDKLFARSGEDPWFRLYPASTSEFFTSEDRTRWTFVSNASGTASEVVARSASTELRRVRVR
jgi:CubicO group peptidase (beta-lactamase class C family)